jgi:hypothetical protein
MFLRLSISRGVVLVAFITGLTFCGPALAYKDIPFKDLSIRLDTTKINTRERRATIDEPYLWVFLEVAVWEYGALTHKQSSPRVYVHKYTINEPDYFLKDFTNKQIQQFLQNAHRDMSVPNVRQGKRGSVKSGKKRGKYRLYTIRENIPCLLIIRSAKTRGNYSATPHSHNVGMAVSYCDPGREELSIDDAKLVIESVQIEKVDWFSE